MDFISYFHSVVFKPIQCMDFNYNSRFYLIVTQYYVLAYFSSTDAIIDSNCVQNRYFDLPYGIE